MGWLTCLGVLALGAVSSQAGRYRVELAGRVLYLEDGQALAASLAPVPGLAAPRPGPLGNPAPGALAPGGLPAPAPVPLAPPETVEEPGAAALAGDLEAALDPPAPPMTQAFRDRMASIYATTDEDPLRAVWSLVQDEDPTLSEGERVGNAVVRYIVGARVPLGGAQVDGPGYPAGTQGNLITSLGLQLRGVPWGGSVGALSQGAAVTITGATDGAWWEVDSSLGRGWVSGPFLRLQ